MKIGIFYIALGKYDRFFPAFYKSCEKYFIPEAQKEYFVFTDARRATFERPGVHCIEQADMGWPDNTMQRFRLFCSVEQQLVEIDYLFFFNANCQFVRPVPKEDLPETGLVVTLHPGWYTKTRATWPFEKNPASCAHIPPGEGEQYVCGGVNGGTHDAYLAMAHELQKRTDEDTANGVVAVHHDESQLNRYVYELPHEAYTVWSPAYAYPEIYHLPGIKMVVKLREKDRYFPVAAGRGEGWGLGNFLKKQVYVWVRLFTSAWQRRFG